MASDLDLLPAAYKNSGHWKADKDLKTILSVAAK